MQSVERKNREVLFDWVDVLNTLFFIFPVITVRYIYEYHSIAMEKADIRTGTIVVMKPFESMWYIYM